MINIKRISGDIYINDKKINMTYLNGANNDNIPYLFKQILAQIDLSKYDMSELYDNFKLKTAMFNYKLKSENGLKTAYVKDLLSIDVDYSEDDMKIAVENCYKILQEEIFYITPALEDYSIDVDLEGVV